ncbi:LysR family transcriptional regulator [Yersinia intermedia]|jgi:DNA-binding transcriptional LysR family regulator|uniref:LysR family transcriptional regulator n=1 Tax=Yersinia intermedia TaxID=631 RepID=A0A0T9MGR4_YERIN|nr:LysR family transcriptional regulator [Yersinia intermedia]CNI67135.1 LysR family transcriptional regulator [Yersinia intermedia]CNI67457.1 LysR family transcriptional regulator [Yersinia intermedia]CNJ29638.1 LysR family transcriptional regulator [Yersinia intermedia]CQD92763.1 LysR family transcriptional regulator [Yersinia intermedia]
MKVTLEELQAFTSVVDCGSITAAAEQRSQTTSGISRALSRLEQSWRLLCCAAPPAG